MTTQAISIPEDTHAAPALRAPRWLAWAAVAVLAAMVGLGAVTVGSTVGGTNAPVANGGQWGGPKRSA